MGKSRFEYPGTLTPTHTERLSGVQVRSGAAIDAIRLRFTNINTGSTRWAFFGGTGGTLRPEFTFEEPERIVEISGRSGGSLDQLTFVTNMNRSYSWGGTGGQPFVFKTRIHGGLEKRISGVTVASKNNPAATVNALVGIWDQFGPCPHFACVQGVAMSPTCDPCVATIANGDSFCSLSAWDAQCVSEVTSMCGRTCQ